MISENAFVINDDNWQSHVDPAVVSGEFKAKGLVPRDYEANPVGSYAAVPSLKDLKLIPREEWIDRIKKQEADQSSLQHIRRKSGPNGGHIPALDQNGDGYCWFYSGTGCVMLRRACMGLPYKRLSGHSGAAIIKKGRDEGGWGALSADFIAQFGVADVDHWKEKSRDIRQDTPETRANMLLYKVDGEWRDLGADVYDANFNEDQACTLLLSNNPIQGDFNWWSHSVMLMRLVLNMRPTEAKSAKAKRMMKTDFGSLDFNKDEDYKVFADVIGKLGLNSWTDNYGDLGEFVLTGTKAKLNGGVAVGVPMAA